MAAQDAELKLKVSLDLAFFRQQLAGLGQAAAGYNMPINIKLDRSAITKELRNLERAIGKKKINVELNLLGGLTKDQLEKIQGRLEALSKTKKVEIPVSVKNGATGRDIQDAIVGIRQRIAANQQIRQGSGKLRIPTSIKPSITNADVSEFKKAVQQKLSGISVKVKAEVEGGFAAGPTGAAGLFEYMRSQGSTGRAFGVRQAQENIARQAILARLEKKSLSAGGYNVKGLEKIIRDLGGTPTGGRTDLVAQAKKLVQESDGIADAVFESLKDLQMKLKPIRGQAQTSAARSMPNLNQMLDRIANLTENPRAAQRMLRMMPESRLTTDLIGAANRQAAFREQFPQGFRMPGFGGAKAFDPLLKAIAKDFSDYAKTVNISDPWVGKIGDGIRRVVAVSAQAAATTKALPPIGGTSSPLNTLERQLASSRGALGTGGGVAGAMFAGRGLANPGVSMLSPVGISGNYRQMAAALANQAANPALAHRQIADIGFGAVPTSATGLSGQALNTALNQAYLQRRGLGISGAQSLPIFGTSGVAVQQNIPGMAYRMGGGGAVPPGGGGAVPPGGGGGGRGGFGGMGGFGGFGRAMGGINLPGAGTIRELGSEFAFATKQVLLFGQAYKMLGFLQDFPGQVGQAVAELQSFKNTLSAISPTAEDARLSNELILGLVERYNIPLESARQGFVKLYASMEPAGFSGKEIGDLFTGVSKAAATLGLSADKVDRVTYAFAQMASKGQIMSEEVTGQLGDVIPGALSIMAEAAGMGLAEFKKAMEDGEFVGKRFTAVMNNVPKVLEDRFGKGAEGAAKAFQGALNNMKTSSKLFYESFEPAAVAFLNTFVTPIASQLRQLADGFNAFFTGVQAQTAGGPAIAQELEKLRPAFDGIRQNTATVASQFKQFAQIALELGKVFVDLAGSPLTGYLIRVYATVLPLVAIIKALNLQAIIPLIASTLRAIPAFVAFNAAKLRLLSTNKALQLSMQLTGSTAAATAGKIRTVGLALGSLVAPATLLGIGALIERFMMLKGAVDEVAQSTKAMLQSISSMANSGAVAALQNVAADTQRQIKTFESLRPFVSGGALGPAKKLTPEAAQKMQEVGLGGFIGGNILGQQEVKDFANASKIIEERLKGLRKALASTREKLPLARRIAADIEAKTRPQDLVPIPEVAADKKGKGTQKSGRALSIDELLGGQIKRELDARRKNLEPALQSELNRVASFGNAEQAERMVRTAAELLDIRYQIDAIDKTIAARGQVRSRIISNSTDKARTALAFDEQTNDLKAKRSELETDIEIAILKQIGAAEKQAREDAAALSDKIEKQKQLNRLIEDAKIAAGIIPPQQAAIIQQERGLEDARARVEAEGTPEQLAQLTAAQALIPQAGSLQETIKTLRDELDKLTSSQELVKAFALSIGDAFSKSFKDAITGASSAQEALAGFFQSVASSFADMAAQMIQNMIQIYIIDKFLNILPGGGMFKGNASIQGGGFGSFSGGAFGIDAGGSLGQVGQNLSIRPFANGGIVTGPTMGLIGEGRYNEAVVPLPDGKSIPVDLGEASNGSAVNVVVNVDAKGTGVQGSDQRGNELGRAISSAVQQELIKQQRPGGLLAGRR